VRHKEFALGDLYRKQGAYRYNSGWNWRAVIATLVGCGLAWSGPVLTKLGISIDFFNKLYNYAWFVGFGTAAITHLVLMKVAPPQSGLQAEAAKERGFPAT